MQTVRVLAQLWVFLVIVGLGNRAYCQQDDGNVPSISEFFPSPMLKVKQTNLEQAKFPVFDIHGHFGIRLKGDATALEKYVEVMGRNNIAVSTSLDAVLGREERHLKFLEPFLDRFVVFAHIDFVGDGKANDPSTHACNQPGFVRQTCELLVAAKAKGISGVKFFKSFGLKFRNAGGTLVSIDDPRFDPIWSKCGELGFPVLIHTADPAAFFEPIDNKNERYEELLRHPNWSFHGDEFPSRKKLLESRNKVIRRNPNTKFIGAHLGNNPEDLATVSSWLDELPNLHVEISSRIGELGRQPVTARKFFIKHQDRILFGTDGPWPEERLRYYWRFLETEDEYFPYSEKQPQPQGLWFIYGVNLPDDVLRKIYCENAIQLVPAARERLRNFGELEKNGLRKKPAQK